jgi:carbon monoxide dehydrogenase subunit G
MIAISSERQIEAPLAKVRSALGDPASYPYWVPGVAGISDLADDLSSFRCEFRFSVFHLSFKVTMQEETEGHLVFRTNAIAIGTVTAEVVSSEVSKGVSKIAVNVGGQIKSKALQRLATSFSDRAADVVTQRLAAFIDR